MCSRLLVLVCLTTYLCAMPHLASAAATCDSTSKGFTPLSQFAPGELYLGAYPGGLYPLSSNVRPALHTAAGLAEAAQVQPLDLLGQPDAQNGSIVLMSIGMCNTSQEYDRFIQDAASVSGKHPRLRIFNGAQGGYTAAEIADSSSAFWDSITVRLGRAGLSPLQVQALWFKEANANPTDPFPTHADSLRFQFGRAMNVMRTFYPNARLCYVSSRIYAGYASTTLNPEPYAYESGFAVKWLIQDQIAGAARLNYDPARGPVVAPWLSWGPYMWADGEIPRADGLQWFCADFQQGDGTHPGLGARIKVSEMLVNFFTSDTTATPWFLAGSTSVAEPLAPDDVIVHSAAPNPARGATRVVVDIERPALLRVDVFTASGRRLATLGHGTYYPGRWTFEWNGADSQDMRVGVGTYFVDVRSGATLLRSQKVVLAR
jgi:hypothetical protein